MKVIYRIFKRLFSNGWISVNEKEPPEAIIWGKFTDYNPVIVRDLSGRPFMPNTGLVMRLQNGKWIHGWQNASEPYVYINVTHWKLKL